DVHRPRPTPLILSSLFNPPATTPIYTLSLHDALPIFPGPVACQNLVVCRMAGKPFVYDHFWVTQLVETGKMSSQQVEQLARRKAIVRDDTDPRANVRSLWRRMRSD